MSWVKFNNVHREAYARRGLPFMEQHGEPVTEFESLVRRSDAYHVWEQKVSSAGSDLIIIGMTATESAQHAPALDSAASAATDSAEDDAELEELEEEDDVEEENLDDDLDVDDDTPDLANSPGDGFSPSLSNPRFELPDDDDEIDIPNDSGSSFMPDPMRQSSNLPSPSVDESNPGDEDSMEFD